jgi:integrase/recombinase XerD
MTEKAISPLRRRLIEDMEIRRLSPKTQYQYIRHVKKFADFLGRSADKATAEDVHAISYGWPRSGRPWEPPTSAPLPCGSSSRSH